MQSSFKLITILVTTLFLISCSDPKSTGGATGGTGGTGGSGTGSSASVPFLVEVRANYEVPSTSTTTPTKTLFGSCEVSTSDPIGTTKTCTIQFPELLLYNSQIEFNVATNNKTTCRKVSFTPYAYLRSTSATFPKSGTAETVDCTTPSSSNPSDPYCWGGAAGGMILPDNFGFPNNHTMYYLTANQLSQKYLFESADIRQDTDRDVSMDTNVVMANKLSAGINLANPINNNLIRYAGGNTFNDYIFTCWDEWANINYQFTIEISDDDSENLASDPPYPAPDYYWDWGN
jgi:hypothetical protein